MKKQIFSFLLMFFFCLGAYSQANQTQVPADSKFDQVRQQAQDAQQSLLRIYHELAQFLEGQLQTQGHSTTGVELADRPFPRVSLKLESSRASVATETQYVELVENATRRMLEARELSEQISRLKHIDFRFLTDQNLKDLDDSRNKILQSIELARVVLRQLHHLGTPLRLVAGSADQKAKSFVKGSFLGEFLYSDDLGLRVLYFRMITDQADPKFTSELARDLNAELTEIHRRLFQEKSKLPTLALVAEIRLARIILLLKALADRPAFTISMDRVREKVKTDFGLDLDAVEDPQPSPSKKVLSCFRLHFGK